MCLFACQLHGNVHNIFQKKKKMNFLLKSFPLFYKETYYCICLTYYVVTTMLHLGLYGEKKT